ncbi:MAG: glycosyltransferase [Proteobacteria bacterium]|nr:glycosyltransferase [Pseudomonadota bacterium]
MRLLFATMLGHLPEMVGGLQTTTDQLARALIRRGIEVAVLCESRTAVAGPTPDYRTFRVADPATALAAVAEGFRPDAIVVQTGSSAVRLLVAALDTAKPTAVYLHNVEESELGGVLLPDPSILYLANSPFTAARWGTAFGLPCEVVPPYVEPAIYLTETTGERILFINPTVQKGVELFFRLAAARPDLGFTVAESWALVPHWRQFCQERAAELGNVEWCAPTDDMRALYGRARLLLMPSLWEEGYGRSALEAQLSGIPVLASTRGNLRETVGAGGLTVDLHAPLEDWLAALDALWTDADGRYAAAARLHARRADADPERIVERFIALLTRHAQALAA